MREKISDKIKYYNKKKCTNKKEIINRINECNLNYMSTINKEYSENISSEFNVSGIGGYGLSLI